MSIRNTELSKYLSQQLTALGGTEAVSDLSYYNLCQFITHGGRKFVIHSDHFDVTLLNVRGGYTVYDKNFVPQYTVLQSTLPAHQPLYVADGLNAIIPDFPFGDDMLDAVFVQSLQPGDYCFLGYELYNNEHDVFVKSLDMLFMSPITALEARSS